MYCVFTTPSQVPFDHYLSSLYPLLPPYPPFSLVIAVLLLVSTSKAIFYIFSGDPESESGSYRQLSCFSSKFLQALGSFYISFSKPWACSRELGVSEGRKLTCESFISYTYTYIYIYTHIYMYIHYIYKNSLIET